MQTGVKEASGWVSCFFVYQLNHPARSGLNSDVFNICKYAETGDQYAMLNLRHGWIFSRMSLKGCFSNTHGILITVLPSKYIFSLTT